MKICKCDRCKKEIDCEPITFQVVNRNQETESIITFFGSQNTFLWKNWELCYECAVEVIRWLAHQENILSGNKDTDWRKQMLTKKDFKAVAEIIKGSLPQDKTSRNDYLCGKRDTLWWAANDLADYFKQENPRFDRERFMKACELE